MKKKVKKRGKRETKKVSKDNTFLYIVIILLILFVWNIVSLYKQPNIIVEDIKSFSFSSQADLIVFSVLNKNNVPGDCSAKLALPEKDINVKLGIINPSQKRIGKVFVRFENGETEITVKPSCKWLNKELINKYNMPECNTLTYEACTLIQNNPDTKQCINRQLSEKKFCFAVISNDVNYCRTIISPLKRIKCKAFITKNPSLCDQLQLQQAKDICYQDYGINMQDIEVCEKIRNESKKLSCLGVVNKNPDLCKDINEDDKALCIINLAEFMNDQSLCKLLKDKEECYTITKK